ncbi:unnamed protein product [Tetraodon nigroviridis]|uniref:(spotted green pufferfish) hypothetical protein n=1 Tax=Tetraodon nigroviridis TaxID=99883 RepID=Q4RU34_TETNG|nr:unnamed protein product [Tetraodon nigroviridis]CAG08098.1 unnamed protein product [Tetraodon nigroviridis]
MQGAPRLTLPERNSVGADKFLAAGRRRKEPACHAAMKGTCSLRSSLPLGTALTLGAMLGRLFD